MSPLMLLSIFLSLFDFLSKTSGFSTQFGHVHPNAVPIYEVDLRWRNSVYYVEFLDKPINKFKINQILVFDEGPLATDVQAEIVHGGIGYNFTRLRLSSISSDKTQFEAFKVNVIIYGLALVYI